MASKKANWLERTANIASIAAGLAAVFIAAVVLHRTALGPALSPGNPSGEVTDWRRYSDGHRLGPEMPLVTIIEFGDYQCPFCKASEPHLEAIRRRFGNDVALVYHHFPLAGHGSAFEAATAAECAGQQDRFWPFHELLYSTESWIGATSDADVMAGLAERAGVASVEEFVSCLEGTEDDYAVNADIMLAQSLGVVGTPTFLVNGQLHVGPLDSLRFETLFDELREGR